MRHLVILSIVLLSQILSAQDNSLSIKVEGISQLKGKIYVGPNHRYLHGNPHTASVGHYKWIETIESTGVTIPMRPGGMSPTIMSPQQLHRERVTGNVKLEKAMSSF